MTWRGIRYRVNLALCNRALVHRQVEGHLDSMEGLATVVGVSRSTASRFFSGRPTSLSVALRIFKVLQLEFAEVAIPLAEEQAEGEPGTIHNGAVSRVPQGTWLHGSD